LESQNRKSFFGFKLFILARTFVRIRYRRALEFIGNLTLLSKISVLWYSIAGIRRHWRIPAMVVEIRQLPLEFGKPNFGQTGRCHNLVYLNSAMSPDFSGPDFGQFGQI